MKFINRIFLIVARGAGKAIIQYRTYRHQANGGNYTPMSKEAAIFSAAGSGNCRDKTNIEIAIPERINKERQLARVLAQLRLAPHFKASALTTRATLSLAVCNGSFC